MWKKIIHHRLTYFFAFAFAFFFISAFGLSQNTFAVSDLVYTIDSSNTSSFAFCGGNSGYSCSDYNYLYTSYSGSCSSIGSSVSIGFNTSNVTGKNISLYPLLSPILYSNISSLFSVVYNSFTTSTCLPFTLTLSENNPYANGITPSGSLSISENGTYDVTNYAEAVVDVPSVGGDYSDDLQDVRNAILIGTASLFVIYFFWAIYKMIMGAVRR